MWGVECLLSVPFWNSDVCTCASQRYLEDGFCWTQERCYSWLACYLAMLYQVEDCLASSVAGKADALYQNWGKCQETVVGVFIKGVFVSITHFRESARRGRLTLYHFYLSPASKRLALPSHIFQVIYSHSPELRKGRLAWIRLYINLSARWKS